MNSQSLLPRPASLDASNLAFWIDEAIWGHRLHDEQNPWLCVLEFLGVFAAEHQHGERGALVEAEPNRLSYTPKSQLRLRNLLFNNPHLAAVQAEGGSEEAQWNAWRERMERGAGGLPDADFRYLQERFQSFGDFVAVVQFLRATALETTSNKRWSSKFVFPFGPSALYEDLNVSSRSTTNDRRFFARTGELLYLMLCRSQRSTELRERIATRFLDEAAPYNRLVQALQGPDQRSGIRAGAYLPYSALPDYDRLAEDWLAVLSRALPTYDALPHLVAITGLNLILYQLARARSILGLDGGPILVVEVVSPTRTVLRDLSAESYAENSSLPQQALDRYIRRITETDEWKAALASGDPRGEARSLLQEHFDWPDPDDADELRRMPTALVEELVKSARTRHKQHVGKFHGTWGRAIGLASRRASRRTRYAPTDALLKSLVIGCVDGRMEFRDFLAVLYARYGLVIGDQQAQSFIERGAADQEAFSDNALRLEERLASLGLLRRLSDSCAYVVNPFSTDSAQ